MLYYILLFLTLINIIYQTFKLLRQKRNNNDNDNKI